MERRSDRELPSIASQQRNPILRSIPIFLVIIITSGAAIFNYQKLSSSVVQSALYAVRTSPKAQEVLGQEVYFKSKVPWIWGSIDQLHGKVDISFSVKGSREKGMMKFQCERRANMGYVSLFFGVSSRRCNC
jgi:cytochrome c oxidase assembly factor 1